MPRPTIVLSVLLIASAVGWARQRAAAVQAVDSYATLRADVEDHALARAQALRAGESLPDLVVVDHRGQRLKLGDLHRGGVRHFYFHRVDCEACGALEPYLSQSRIASGASFAFIEYSRSQSLKAPTAAGRFAVVPQELPERRYIASVPAFFTATDNGRVSAAADFEFRAVVGLLDLVGVVDGPTLLTELAARAPVSSRISSSAQDSSAAPSLPVRMP